MARISVAEGRVDDANAYYHRAIYGSWPPVALNEPHKVRLELAKLLADHGNNRELLSELLLLQSAPAQDTATRKLIAALFLQSGSTQRAADAYRALIHDYPADVDARLGLAQAEVLTGNYRAAESAMMSALRREPYNESIQSQLRRVVKLASLDPTVRHLSNAERQRRAEAILKLVQNDTAACNGPAPESSAKQDPEVLLDQAEALWKKTPESCRKPASADDPLPLLLKKLQ
jgi:Flp pilus assembly protein TadD